MTHKKIFQAGETQSIKIIVKDVGRTKHLRINVNPKEKLSESALGTVRIRVLCRMAEIKG